MNINSLLFKFLLLFSILLNCVCVCSTCNAIDKFDKIGHNYATKEFHQIIPSNNSISFEFSEIGGFEELFIDISESSTDDITEYTIAWKTISGKNIISKEYHEDHRIHNFYGATRCLITIDNILNESVSVTGNITFRNSNRFIQVDDKQNATGFAINDTYGANMNQDASLGDPVNVHNGTDDTYWTASAITGNWTFDSTDQASDGIRSIRALDQEDGDTMQITNGVSPNIAKSIAGKIYIDKWTSSGIKNIKIYAWSTANSTILGVSVNINDYVNVDEAKQWLDFSIPIDDMELSSITINAIRIQTQTTGVAPDYYLDSLLINTSGEIIEYIISPPDNSWLAINTFLIVAQITSNVTSSGDTVSLNIDEFFGQTYNSGIQQQRIIDNQVAIAVNFSSLRDILQFQSADISKIYTTASGMTTFRILLKSDDHIILKSENDDEIRFVISEDFSPFSFLRINYGGYIY